MPLTLSNVQVKLTEPVTAILYITADHEHMNELKHTIHVVEVRRRNCQEPLRENIYRLGRLQLTSSMCWNFIELAPDLVDFILSSGLPLPPSSYYSICFCSGRRLNISLSSML